MNNHVLEKWASCKKNPGTTSVCDSPNEAYLREFNKGKSFEYSQWQPLVTYTNDSVKQDFVRYNNTILACKCTHVASDPPELIYNSSGVAIGVNSDVWEFVISQNVITNNYYIDGVTTKGIGIPILSKDMLDGMQEDEIPDPFISINPIDSEEEEVTNIDILFSAVRKLQAEVTKMRNAFKYGMYSYTGTNTAVSNLVDNDLEATDALWSVDEDDLSEVTSYVVDFEGVEFPFEPKENVNITESGVVKFIGDAIWTDYLEELYNMTDPKLYLYMTTSNLNINFNLNSHSSENNINIDLSNFGLNKTDKYNIIFLVSRKTQKVEDKGYYGYNYIWLSIRNYQNNNLLLEGFYDTNDKNIKSSIVELSDRYYIDSINFNNLSLYKFNFYSKYQDFSTEILPSTPDDTDYKYRVAHLTIRAVKNYAELEKIQNQLPNNELIWEEATRRLWIKSQDSIISIGNSINQDTGMTQTETIELLQKWGIVYIDENGELQLSNVSDVTFINNDTGRKFKFAVSPEGDLRSTPLPKTTLAERIAALSENNRFSTESSFRGFVAKLHCGETKGLVSASNTSDVGIYSDRVKIGAIYCPFTSDTVYGCSHAYIELENTSDQDFSLDGVYLHYLHPVQSGATTIDRLALDGILPAGSTYLIRGKQYADPNTDSNVYVNVDTYDKEWYIDGELIDLSIDNENAFAFALTYGKTDSSSINGGGAEISINTPLVTENTSGGDKATYSWKWYYIDSIVLNKNYSSNLWGTTAMGTSSNSIIKNTFELDPAKQAFQALTTYDSSRYRTNKYGTDGQTVNLNNEFIKFPHTDFIYPVSNYTPKSSKCRKNVSTDKTKFDLEKPNAVKCSFGINGYTTRCFNWVSAGSFNEYVFIKNGDSWIPFESYTNINYEIDMLTTYPRRKEFSVNVNNTIYSRINKIFPGCNIRYTAHKCIIDIVDKAVTTKTTYTYIVGRMSSDGTPDLDHCSDEYTFTLYPESYTPRVYQITDQQGFHWIEYQVWSAAAAKLNDKIIADCNNENIIPILINTGDMTQNGTRVNEWLDYHNAGLPLFSHLEQMNVVGNNDLCGTDPEVLGTGDDVGKSNSFYFHIFHCYEVDTDSSKLPIITGDDNISRYVPSLYYFDFANLRCVMVNSEITYINCRDWFKKTDEEGNVVNVYTGWTVEGSYKYVSGFNTIYTMLYNILNTSDSKKVIVACHEMPFTVITSDGLSSDDSTKKNWRSYSGKGSSLIGSHLNQLCGTDTKYGIYWFSRLLEHFKVKLCIGGHKHTYAATLPIREHYTYVDNGITKDSVNGPMTMSVTLENDNVVNWFSEDGSNNLSKLPYVPSNSGYDMSEIDNMIRPCVEVADLEGGIVYFMCQATGYKLTSNKELPSNYQRFSSLIPQTNGTKADGNQQYPMYVELKFDGDNIEIYLGRLTNILNSKYKFNQQTYGTGEINIEYAVPSTTTERYCGWNTTKTSIITV